MKSELSPGWKVGRLLDPEASLGTDPRMDPRVAAIVQKAGVGDFYEPDVSFESPREDLLAFSFNAEAAHNAMVDVVLDGQSEPAGDTEVLILQGRDGNEIKLYVRRPASGSEDAVPCVLHIHGGGMVIGSATSPLYVKWREDLASAGVVAMAVEFRNAGGELGPHPFPAGINDCADAIRWIAERREDLGLSSIVLWGDSGGAALALSVAIMANREGWADQIAGVYAQGPFIAGPDEWREPSGELISLIENNGYQFSLKQACVMAEIYDPGAANRNDGVCWALQATEEDLVGLPPHVLDLFELDCLRDEGIAYYRRLRGAGVEAVAKVILGMPHTGDVLFGSEAPEVVASTIASITGFARSL